jgi:hypothetical protein
LSGKAAAGGHTLGVDLAPLVLGQVAVFEQTMDEEPHARLGGKPTGRGVRRVEQAEFFQVRHDVAQRGRRERKISRERLVST